VNLAVAAGVDESRRERQRLVSDLFHALSQPITALRCSLELALHTRTTAAPSQENLETALAHAEQIARLATGIRELIQAEDPGDERRALSLADCWRETERDMQPVAEAGQVKMELRGDAACQIITEPRRLRQGLFYLLEFALTSAAVGSGLDLEVHEQGGQAVTELTVHQKSPALTGGPASAGSEADPKSQALSRRLGLAIAGRIFETSGGRLQIQEGPQQLRLKLHLPLAL
jgi:signal transduction histidine kinase